MIKISDYGVDRVLVIAPKCENCKKPMDRHEVKILDNGHPEWLEFNCSTCGDFEGVPVQDMEQILSRYHMKDIMLSQLSDRERFDMYKQKGLPSKDKSDTFLQ